MVCQGRGAWAQFVASHDAGGGFAIREVTFTSRRSSGLRGGEISGHPFDEAALCPRYAPFVRRIAAKMKSTYAVV
jgi:hypothetical protein